MTHTIPSTVSVVAISNAPAFGMCGGVVVPGTGVPPLPAVYAYAFARARRLVALERFRRETALSMN